MIDLHLHLDGSLTPEEVLTFAGISGVSLPTESAGEIKDLLTVQPGCRNLGEYLEKFELPLQVLQTTETLELSVCGLVKRLAQQGLCYAEIRFAPQFHTKKGLTQREVIQAAANGLKKGIKESGMPANLILCCMRGKDNSAENQETVSIAGEFLGKGVCALDLAGNEAAFPTRDFADIFLEAKEQGIPVIIHAGEAAGAESVRSALELGAVRIGHGIHAIEDPALMEELKERDIVLELCYSSNLQTKAADSSESYPLAGFMERGIRTSVNTDNMTVSDTTLWREYDLLQRQFSFGEEVLRGLALNAVQGAFVTAKEKERLREQVIQDFSEWLRYHK